MKAQRNRFGWLTGSAPPKPPWSLLSKTITYWRVSGEGLAGTVARIKKELAVTAPLDAEQETRDELIALSLFGGFEQTVFRVAPGRAYTREELLRTHLWLFLAAQAARHGEIDIDARLRKYEGLIKRLASQMPPLPPQFET